MQKAIKWDPAQNAKWHVPLLLPHPCSLVQEPTAFYTPAPMLVSAGTGRGQYHNIINRINIHASQFNIMTR